MAVTDPVVLIIMHSIVTYMADYTHLFPITDCGEYSNPGIAQCAGSGQAEKKTSKLLVERNVGWGCKSLHNHWVVTRNLVSDGETRIHPGARHSVSWPRCSMIMRD